MVGGFHEGQCRPAVEQQSPDQCTVPPQDSEVIPGQFLVSVFPRVSHAIALRVNPPKNEDARDTHDERRLRDMKN